jgi:predicted dehydrogenase
MKSVLIVGWGSIGQRHYKNLITLKCHVDIVSRRKDKLDISEADTQVFDEIVTALNNNKYDIVFICTETVQHKVSLDILLNLNFKGQVIVEKPLFDLEFTQFEHFNQLNIHVSYNLRFHPLLQKLKSELRHDKVLSAHIYVGQYLPTWRPTIDYKKSYSSFSELGGGVLLDLSHELDFSCWLFGKARGVFCRGGHFSELEINSMDTCGLIIEHENCPIATVQLNYTDRMTQRFLIVNTNTTTYKIDFIQKQFFKNKEQVPVQESDSYVKMCENILLENSNQLTTYTESVALMKLMQNSMLSSENKVWNQL